MVRRMLTSCALLWGLMLLHLLSTGCEAPGAPGGPAAVQEAAVSSQPGSQPGAEAAAASQPNGTGQEFPVPKPPFSEGIFPCSDCHADLETNLKRRKLEDEHTNIKLHHGPRERWCFDCHNPDDRDKLRLADGELIPFSRSYLLCGQCHGPKLRDWRAGVHGKRTGRWDGRKRYLLCAHCHNPHSPRFKPIKPMPPPHRPADIR
jgi:hypothetical protein